MIGNKRAFFSDLFLVPLTNDLVLLSGTSADDLFPLFDRYGKVVDVFIPRDRRYFLFFGCILKFDLLNVDRPIPTLEKSSNFVELVSLVGLHSSATSMQMKLKKRLIASTVS